LLCGAAAGAHNNGQTWNPDGIELVMVEGNDSVRGFYIGRYEVTQAQWKASWATIIRVNSRTTTCLSVCKLERCTGIHNATERRHGPKG
jgi:hypothetical protein